MAVLTRLRVDSTIEQRIVTGLIVSSSFLRKIYDLFDLVYFKNTYTKEIAKWAINYYEVFEDAPFAHIQDIFNKNKSKLKEEDADLIASLLTKISERYEMERNLNVDYVLKETETYFRKRQLEITSENIRILLKSDKVERAEMEIEQFKKVQYATLGFVEPLSEEAAHNMLMAEKEDFFSFPGALGRFIKPIGRGWLVGLAGAFKRGKTWLAQEFGIVALLLGFKVVFISLEMTTDNMVRRIFMRMTAAGKKKGLYKIPVFDCLHNQDGSCDLPDRTQNIPILNDEGAKPEYDEHHPYRVCTACRNDPHLRQNYQMDTWFEMEAHEEFDQEQIYKVVDSFEQFQNSYKVLSYPKFSANIGDINRDLDALAEKEGFIPHFIIVDYAEILKPEEDRSQGIDQIDRTWIALAQMAASRFATVISPTQVTKVGQDVEVLTAKDMARWVGKLAHVDALFAINQNAMEKLAGIVRIGTVAHRHEEFHEYETVTVLQQLELGQPHLDSERG